MTCVVNVSTPTDTPDAERHSWSLRIEQHGARFYGSLKAPGGQEVALTRSQPTAAQAVESVTTWLLVRGLTHVCTALRASADAELRQ